MILYSTLFIIPSCRWNQLIVGCALLQMGNPRVDREIEKDMSWQNWKYTSMQSKKMITKNPTDRGHCSAALRPEAPAAPQAKTQCAVSGQYGAAGGAGLPQSTPDRQPRHQHPSPVSRSAAQAIPVNYCDRFQSLGVHFSFVRDKSGEKSKIDKNLRRRIVRISVSNYPSVALIDVCRCGRRVRS